MYSWFAQTGNADIFFWCLVMAQCAAPENAPQRTEQTTLVKCDSNRWSDHSQIVTKWADEPISLLQLQHAVCFGRLYRFSRKKGAHEVDYSVKQHFPFQIFKLVTQLCTASLASSPAEFLNRANQTDTPQFCPLTQQKIDTVRRDVLFPADNRRQHFCQSFLILSRMLDCWRAASQYACV